MGVARCSTLYFPGISVIDLIPKHHAIAQCYSYWVQIPKITQTPAIMPASSRTGVLNNGVKSIMADLTHSASELRNLALEALEKGDFKTATALAENASDTEFVQQQTRGSSHVQQKSQTSRQ